MLSSIATLPWGGLSGCYDQTPEIAEAILALARADPAQRSKGLSTLWSCIWHQGTRYEVSPYVVPFLYELLAAPATRGKHEIINLLAYLALGFPDEYVPSGFDILAARQTWVDFERIAIEENYEPALRFALRGSEQAHYDAVGGGIHTLINLLDDGEPAVRQAAAFAVAWFPEHAAEALPRLRERAQGEDEPAPLASLIVAIGLLERSPYGGGALDEFESFLSHSEPIVRGTAALALCHNPLSPAARRVLHELLLSHDHFIFPKAVMPFCDGNLVRYATDALTICGPRIRDETLAMLCAALPQAEPAQALDCTNAILHFAARQRSLLWSPSAPADLEDWQRAALRAVSDHGCWLAKDAPFGVRERWLGMPDTQEHLRRYLDGDDTIV
ncbi:MAG TPA: hypothetical protein VGE07_11175 [Herpetosiphonaceae bacterium]